MDYVIGKIDRSKGVCILGHIMGVENNFELSQGISRQKGWPKDAHFEMDKNFPKDIKLEDFHENMTSLLVVSSRVKDLVEKEKVTRIECLPVWIVNHKGRREKDQYWVLHSTPLIDCIDLKKSKPTVNEINPDDFSNVENLTIDPKKVPKDAKLFRLEKFSVPPIFRTDLVDKIQSAGFKGMEFIPTQEWSWL
jgi:hypothetical protein